MGSRGAGSAQVSEEEGDEDEEEGGGDEPEFVDGAGRLQLVAAPDAEARVAPSAGGGGGSVDQMWNEATHNYTGGPIDAIDDPHAWPCWLEMPSTLS